MILRPFNLMLTACVLGVAISVIAAILNSPHTLDPLSAAGAAFAFALGLLVSITVLRFTYAAVLFVMAVLLVLARSAAWIVALLSDPLGLRNWRAERALIDHLYPPPASDRRLDVPA